MEPKMKKAKVKEPKVKKLKVKEPKVNAPKAKKPKAAKGKGINLYAVLVGCSMIPLIISIAIISSLSSYVIKKNLEKDAENLLLIAANDLASYCLDNEITAMNAADYYEYIDSLQEHEIELAIIAEGTPCTTSIKNENGYRVREILLSINLETDAGLLKNGYYDKNVQVDGNVYFGYYLPIMNGDEMIAVAFAGKLKDSIMGNISNVTTMFIVVAVVLAVAFTILVLLFSTGIKKLFDGVGARIKALAGGDLSVQKKQSGFVKELNNLFDSTGAMQQDLAVTIGNVKDVSGKLTDDIAEVTALSEESTDAVNVITVSMNQLSAASASMDENVQNINMQMQEIDNCVNDISQNVEHLYKSSENILRTNNESKANMDIIMENSKKSVEAVSDISDQIKQTNASIAEIDQAVELILSISRQTNLLSLNASIEAARAGEMGKGFAVVAQEIRNLSEQSANGAEMIKNLAQTITEKSEKSVELVGRVNDLIMQEQASVAQTQKKYDEHSKDISESVTEIKAIAEKTENLERVKEIVVGSVHELSAISEENAASNEEVSNKLESIVSGINKVNDRCEKMSGMAHELQESVAYFKE